MKKILSLIIVLACALSLFACGGGNGGNGDLTDIQAINKMYSVSCPTKIETTSTQLIEGRTLTGTETIIAGKIDGKDAAVYEYSYEQFAAIEDASSSPIVTTQRRTEYLEGYGTRNNGGSWNAEGADFSPKNGSIAIVLTDETVENETLSEDGKTFTCTVKAENTAAVFGEARAVAADVSVTITTNGTVVTGVVLTYNVAATASTPAVAVTITTNYSYDIEAITLTK